MRTGMSQYSLYLLVKFPSGRNVMVIKSDTFSAGPLSGELPLNLSSLGVSCQASRQAR